MSQRRARAQRQAARAAGVVVKPAKVPTPVEARSGSWRSREVDQGPGKKSKLEIRPTEMAVRRGDVLDLGWAPRSKYFTVLGALRKAVRP